MWRVPIRFLLAVTLTAALGSYTAWTSRWCNRMMSWLSRAVAA